MRFQSVALLGLCLASACATAFANKPVQMSSSAIFFYDCGELG